MRRRYDVPGRRLVAELILGPLLRYAGTEDATVWVETDGPAGRGDHRGRRGVQPRARSASPATTTR